MPRCGLALWRLPLSEGIMALCVIHCKWLFVTNCNKFTQSFRSIAPSLARGGLGLCWSKSITAYPDLGWCWCYGQPPSGHFISLHHINSLPREHLGDFLIDSRASLGR